MPKPDLFEAAELRDEPEYWDAVARRIATTAIRSTDGSGRGWLGGSRAAWVTVCLVVAAALALTMLPDAESSQTSQRAEWANVLAPSDEIGQAIVVRENPPAVAALLLNRAR